MQIIAKPLRGVRTVIGLTRSILLLAWYRSLYSGLAVGSGVYLGRGVHISVVRGGRLTISDDVVIERNCQLIVEGALAIGARTFIGTGTIIVAAEHVTIGCDCLIAAYATIRDQDHRTDLAGEPYNRQGLLTAPVQLGENVWVGTKATVLRGTTIGKGAVVGAHALVASPVDAETIVGGVPAKFLKRVDRSLPALPGSLSP